MYLYSIMPLALDECYDDAVCDDIARQYRDGIATEALFSMTLTPEGNPVTDKAEILCGKYRRYREKLAQRGIRSGVLVQASIGHGYVLTTKMPFDPVVGLTDLKEQYVACPYGEGFRDYIRRAMTTIAREAPSTIMVDDDFRLFYREIRGCVCPLHMKEINRRAGTSYTKEQLRELLLTDTEESRRMMKIFYQTQVDSLIGAARAMREGIDAVDPTLQGAFCACGDTCEGASEIAKILAGEGNPVIVRVNNGRYCAPGARGVVESVARAAEQIGVMKKGVDVFLAETDTCPQNRYSTSASSLHTHFTATILEGVAGCKHWITRMGAYETRSAEAYRRKLSQNSGFYRTLSALVPTLRFDGCRIPLSGRAWEPTVPFDRYKFASKENSWALCVLERLGLPMYYSEKEGGAVFLDGARDRFFTDDEILKMLGGTVFLAAESASSLEARGFGRYLGVSLAKRTQDDEKASGEEIYETAQRISPQQGLMKLACTEHETEVHSMVYTMAAGKTRLPLFPGVTSYRNALGGTVVTFAGTPLAPFHYGTAFSFLCESRKRQLEALLRMTGNLPVYYPDDAEVYLKSALTKEGERFVAFFNVGLDPLEQIPLVCDFEVQGVRMLLSDGTFRRIDFKVHDGCTTVFTPAGILDPVILILS